MELFLNVNNTISGFLKKDNKWNAESVHVERTGSFKTVEYIEWVERK